MKVHKDNIKFIEEVCFQKGKDEVINKLKKKFKSNITVISKREFLNELEQLSKGIWEEKQDDTL